MRAILVAVFCLFGGARGLPAGFVPNDVQVGDPSVSYMSTEFTPDFRFLVWGEYANDGSDDLVVWHCGVDPDTGELVPWDGKGFRAFESTGWGRANSPGRDAQGVYYAGLNREGRIVVVRPTGETSGLVEVLPAPVDFSRRALYGLDLPPGFPSTGYVFWISNTEGLPVGPGSPLVSNVQLRYLALSNPGVQLTLQDQPRPPGAGGFAPLDAAFPRNLRGTPLLTSGVRIGDLVQLVEFDLTETSPTQRLVSNDPRTKTDAFGFTFADRQILLSGGDSVAGATQVYTRLPGQQYFQPAEQIVPQVDTLEPPLFAQSNEHIEFDGRVYTAFQVNSRADEFFGTTFQQTGEIWLASVQQDPQRQWRVSDDSDRAKFEPEPFIGRGRVWVFYSSTPRGSELRSTTITLRRAETPLVLSASAGDVWLID